jgi:peptidoglycan lytic transglycosylase
VKAWLRAETLGVLAIVVVLTIGGTAGIPGAQTSEEGGTKVRVTNVENGKSVVVTINDRMKTSNSAMIDVSRHAAEELGFAKSGKAKVKLEIEK